MNGLGNTIFKNTVVYFNEQMKGSEPHCNITSYVHMLTNLPDRKVDTVEVMLDLLGIISCGMV